MTAAAPLAWWAGLPYSREAGVLLFTVLPVWAFGAIIGLLLPRPKWLEAGATSQAFLGSPLGLALRRLSLLYQAAYLARAIWSFFSSGQSFQSLQASWGGAASTPASRPHRRHRRHRERPAGAPAGNAALTTDDALLANWYVQEEDLQYFKDAVENTARRQGTSEWELMMAKDFGGGIHYSAWRCTLPDGKTDYKSVTVAEDATAQEFMDFYLDDNARAKWDSMISQHEVLENGVSSARCQVVRWVRSFPFSFIKEREYIIARRQWEQAGCLYGISKAVPHPRAPCVGNIVRMDSFYSMWRSRTIPCPRGTGRPACETVLLHREDFKIPERLSRFAVRHGMAGFVKKMGAGVHPFVESRRARVDPFEADAAAFGVGAPLNPPRAGELSRAMSTCSLASTTSFASTEGAAEGSALSVVDPTRGRRRRLGLVRQFGCALAATWAAVVISGVR